MTAEARLSPTAEPALRASGMAATVDASIGQFPRSSSRSTDSGHFTALPLASRVIYMAIPTWSEASHWLRAVLVGWLCASVSWGSVKPREKVAIEGKAELQGAL